MPGKPPVSIHILSFAVEVQKERGERERERTGQQSFAFARVITTHRR